MKKLLIIKTILLLLTFSCTVKENPKITSNYELKIESLSENISVQTIGGVKLELNEEFESAFIVFSDSQICHDCFKSLSKIHSSINEQLNLKSNLIAILPFEKNTLANKNKSQLIKNLLKQDTTFFDLDSTSIEFSKINLFDKYQIKNTPTLLLLYKNKICYFNNNELFDNYNEKDLTMKISKFFNDVNK